MPLDYPLVNGFRFDFASIELRLKNRRRRGFREISYTTSRQHGNVMADSDRKIGRTRGQVNDEASITMLKEEADALIRELGPGFGTVSFDVVVTYSAGALTQTDTLVGCCIGSVGNAHSAGGTEGLQVTLQLNVTEILINGLRI